jgi:putative SOS response-associated peptidase YedK
MATAGQGEAARAHCSEESRAVCVCWLVGNRWKSPEGEEILSCTIITTETNELLK